MRDLSRGNARYNAPTFCGVCDPETRDNRDFLVKGTYFLSTEKLGSHNIVVGYDNFSGTRKANNYQSGSNYRSCTGAIWRSSGRRRHLPGHRAELVRLLHADRHAQQGDGHRRPSRPS